MRVLVLESTYPRWPGDAQPTFIHDFCRHLPDCEVHVLAPGAEGAAASEVRDGVQVHRYRYAPLARWQRLAYGSGMLGNVRRHPLLLLLLPVFLLAQVAAIVRLQRAHGFDVIHAHWLIPQGVCAALALQLLPRTQRPPLLLTAHGTDVHAFSGAAGTWLKRYALRRAAAVTAVSGALAARLAVLSPRTVPPEVAPMGTVLPATAGTPAHEREGYCFVGRFVPGKGVVELIDAYAAAQARSAARLPVLTLAGDGPLRAQVEARIATHGLAGQVRLAGWLTREPLTALVASSRCLLMASREEGLGLAVVEALALGTPVIALAYPALADLRALGDGIVPLPAGDHAALADAIAQAAQPGHLPPVPDSTRAAVTARFAWPAVAARYRNLYARLSGG
jgi:glycosyltransferase involved in cell wall biosynthesis